MLSNDRGLDSTQLNAVLSYCPENGQLHWKARPTGALKDRKWNGRFAGKLAGTLRSDGYRRVKVCGRYQLEHRVIWAMVYDTPTGLLVDHKNRIKDDNRIMNLRLATKSENCTNSLHPSISGVKGVRFDVRYNNYQVRITKRGVTTHLGTVSTVEEGANLYAAHAEDFHGDFKLEGV